VKRDKVRLLKTRMERGEMPDPSGETPVPPTIVVDLILIRLENLDEKRN